MTNRRTASPRADLGTLIGYGALLLALIQAIAPVVWIVMGSFKTRPEFYADPWAMPNALLIQNYADAITIARVGDYVLNSAIVVGMGLALLMVAASTAAYALARYDFPGRNTVMAVILMTMMVPPDILTIPLFVVMREMGLLGTYFGLACVYAVSGFGMSVFLLRGYFLSVPKELEEAARLEGAGPLRILWSVILPLCMPGFLSVLIIQFMGMWNDLYLAFVFLRDPAMATVPLGLLNFFQRDSVDWPRLFAALAMLTVPVLLVYAVAQRRFVEGFTAGAVK